jgi:hypothetical protein
MPIRRLVKLIINEREHLSPYDCNLVFVDFSYWSQIDRHYLDAELYRNIIVKALRKKMSSRIHGILTYITSNEKDERLVSRRVLYLNSNKPSLNESEVQRFLKLWQSGN